MFRSSRMRSRKHDHEVSSWRHVVSGFLVFLVVGILVGGTMYVTRMPVFTLSSVVVTGGETISVDTVESRIEEVLNGDYLKLIPHRFVYLLPHEELRAAIATIPRVHDVAIVRDQRNTLSVSFTEYVPTALWCKDDAIDDLCYFLDETGYAFASGPLLRGGTLVRHIREGDGALERGQAFHSESFRALNAFLEKVIEELHFRITDVRYKESDDIELRINGGGKILFTETDPYEQVFLNLETILASSEFKHLEPGNFQYIDLRFGNKIFVNEQPEVTGTTTTATSTNEESTEELPL